MGLPAIVSSGRLSPIAPIHVRAATQSDEPFLWEALYHALYVPPGHAPPMRAILEIPQLRNYVRGWSADREPGVIAEMGATPIGAAWVRLLAGEECGYGYVADDVPELAFAVLPEFRSRGTGTRMLDALLAAASDRYRAVSLSVHAGNPARRLYERAGFREVRSIGQTVVMCRDRPPRAVASR
jgi:GNAT superfamily N-acetyltransferase